MSDIDPIQSRDNFAHQDGHITLCAPHRQQEPRMVLLGNSVEVRHWEASFE